MLEPRPAEIQPPKAQEPKLKIGIVLEEDRKSYLTVRVSRGSFELQGQGVKVPLEGARNYLLRNIDGALALEFKGGQLALSRQPLSICDPAPQALEAKAGIILHPMVVGRSFHWRKELELSFAGAVHFYAAGKYLVAVNEINLEQYLACVLSSEMGTACPAEFMKAQAIAARSWVVVFLHNKHTGTPYTICNDDDCQRYQGTTYLSQSVLKAVGDCRGEFLITADNLVCAAYYSKSCGGHSEEPENVLGFKVRGLKPAWDAFPKRPAKLDLREEEQFLQWLSGCHHKQLEVFCSPATVPEAKLSSYLGAVDEKGAYYRWEHSITEAELIQNLKDRFKVGDIAEILDLAPTRRGYSGRILGLEVKYKDTEGAVKSFNLSDQYDIRRALHRSFLLSSAITYCWERNQDGQRTLAIKGCGWGHGLGLCQIGAVGMALKGFNCQDILRHYYPDCRVVKAY